MKILVATNNWHKIKEISCIMKEYHDILTYLDSFNGLSKPLEDGNSYYENALKKASHYYDLTGLPTLADDSGIEIDAFDGKPGIYSSRFIEPNLSFNDRNSIVLERLKDIPDSKRNARFKCCCVFMKSKKDIKVEYGVLEGKIGCEIKGVNGFGYDPIFFIPDKKLYIAEVSSEEKNIISHRAQAFNKMKKHLPFY